MNLGIVIVFMGLIFGAMLGVPYLTKDKVLDATILKNPEYVCTGGKQGNCSSVVFTDKETFHNKDAWLFGKTNSRDIHGRLKEGDMCDVYVTGFRFSLLSMFRNIYKIQCNAVNLQPKN